jgi:hypothetical protein
VPAHRPHFIAAGATRRAARQTRDSGSPDSGIGRSPCCRGPTGVPSAIRIRRRESQRGRAIGRFRGVRHDRRDGDPATAVDLLLDQAGRSPWRLCLRLSAGCDPGVQAAAAGECVHLRGEPARVDCFRPARGAEASWFRIVASTPGAGPNTSVFVLSPLSPHLRVGPFHQVRVFHRYACPSRVCADAQGSESLGIDAAWRLSSGWDQTYVSRNAISVCWRRPG